MFIRYVGPWEDVAGPLSDVGRHIISVHRLDTDDLTVASDPTLPCPSPLCAVGLAAHLSPLRPGEVEITAAEYATESAAIVAYNAALPPAPLPPDPDGLRRAVLTAFGLAAANAIFSRYPTAAIALTERDYPVLRGTVDLMLAEAAITTAQHAAMQDLMTEYRIPGGV